MHGNFEWTQPLLTSAELIERAPYRSSKVCYNTYCATQFAKLQVPYRILHCVHEKLYIGEGSRERWFGVWARRVTGGHDRDHHNLSQLVISMSRWFTLLNGNKRYTYICKRNGPCALFIAYCLMYKFSRKSTTKSLHMCLFRFIRSIIYLDYR